MRNYHVMLGVILVMVGGGAVSQAVTSRIHRHRSFQDFDQGDVNNVIVESRGAIRLGRSAAVIADDFEQAWSINCISIMGGAVYYGTSPNGKIYRHHFGEQKLLYPKFDRESVNDPNGDQTITNEHIFVMTTDLAGRLVTAISGADCRLDRFSTDGRDSLFELEDAQYIFALAADERGYLYIGTGPKGKVYQLDALGKKTKLIYTCRDDNILSLTVGPDGFVYAGSDGRGVIYRIDPNTSTATILYDSPLPEITGLHYVSGLDQVHRGLYALATSAKIVESEVEFAVRNPLPGRPEKKESSHPDQPDPKSGGGQQFHIAGQSSSSERTEGGSSRSSRRRPRTSTMSGLWRITPEGFAVEVAQRRSVLFCIEPWQDKLLIGTGNQGQLLRVDPAEEQVAVLYEDTQASQITAVATTGKDIYVGTANPARLVRLSQGNAPSGTYISSLLDAEQPARWGRLQLDADVPKGCQVWVACRSGNVEDTNDPTFSAWTEPVLLTDSVSLNCPLGRFCQYKLILHSSEGDITPFIREVAVASSIPNLAPHVESIDFVLSKVSSKQGFVKIGYITRDINNDTLQYSLYFRQRDRRTWVELIDDHTDRDYEWNTKTVADGYYEVKVVANDALSNTPATALTGSRISQAFLVDNTAPEVKSYRIEKRQGGVTLHLFIEDALSAIQKLDYTVNSNHKWHGAIPDDLVYDTKKESFQIKVDLEPGEHVIALRIQDGLMNTNYFSYVVEP